MPGWTNSDNKYGLTPYIVGTTLGDGCNYTSIQTAINDAFAAGGGVVGIRKGTYTENLTLQPNVELYGFDVDGRLPSVLSQVAIVGNHTFTVAGGFGAQLSQYINFSCAAGDLFTINATGGGQAILAQKFCGCEAFTVGGQRICALNADGGSACQYSTDNTNLNSSGSCFESLGAGSHGAFISLGNINSQTADVFTHSSGSASLNLEYLGGNAALYIFNGVVGNGNFASEHSQLSSGLETVLFPAGNGQAQVYHCTVSSGAGSGFWVDGTGGQLDYADVAFTASANGVGPLITEQKTNWQPYGEEGAPPGVGVPRGTSAFSNVDFDVVDGFVSLAGSTAGPVTQLTADDATIATPNVGNINLLGQAGCSTTASGDTLFVQSVAFTEQAVNFAATIDSGYWVAGGVTVTLPNAGLIDGTMVVVGANAAGVVIQADPAHTIRLGNLVSVAGGTATSTADGDILTLRYRVSTAQWFAQSAIGNWTIV